MSHTLLNQQLLESLKRSAKKKKRDDPSLSHSQWLDALSAEHGYATFSSLKRRVEELEQQAHDAALAVEDEQWAKRFEEPMVWGRIADGRGELGETLPLPVSAGSVPWVNCFSGSSLFTCADGPRRQLDGPLYTFGSPEMHFQGEELRVADDQTIFMALISATGQLPCGRLVEFSTEDLDKAIGLPLPEFGIPVEYDAIARTLWRLVHCELTVSEFKFKGPLLSYADARRAPGHFAIRFNPDFANFYYPVLALFS
jgi:hypothetical protein